MGLNFKNKIFPGQQDNEIICLVVRQHWSIFARHFLVWLLFVAILLGFDNAINAYLPELRDAPYIQYVNLFETIYLMYLVLSLFIIWTLYYLNVDIVTNQRVVDITQKSLLHHTISELHLNRLQDVTAEVKGFWETFLDYGHVYIQTAGETERFVFQRVPNPTKISKLILDLYEKLPPQEKQKG